MRFRSLFSIAAVALAGSVLSANATTLSVLGAQCASDAPTTITGAPLVSLDCGGTSTVVNGQTVNRTLTSNFNLGAADGQFFSLGLDSGSSPTGGIIAFEFSSAFTGSASFFEVTNPGNHREAAEVRVGTSDDFSASTLIGIVDNGAAGAVAANTTLEILGGPWTHLFMVDVSRAVYADTASGDGYDIDAISLTSAVIPLPAGLVLLGSALVGLALRRRRKA